MKKIALIIMSAFVLNAAMAQKGETSVEVGGAPMYASRNIIENSKNSADHTILLAAIRAAGLLSTFQGTGPLTVFAPTNAAFEKLPKGTLESLLRPENKPLLSKLVTYHVVAGRLDTNELIRLINEGAGAAILKTLSGGTLVASMKGDKIMLMDERGDMSTITIRNVYQSNGVMHVIDAVLRPV